MPRFFCSRDMLCGTFCTITGSDAQHISRSLRMKPGDPVDICDSEQNEYSGIIESITRDEVRIRLGEAGRSLSEPPCRVTVYQALPKGDKLDSVIQKSVETGACAIIPFESEHCVARHVPEKAERLASRRAAIALEAAKQCGRGTVPVVGDVISFREAVSDALKGDIAFMCYEGDGTEPLPDILSAAGHDIRFLVGPEGGFSPSEAEYARSAGLRMCGLGRRILRTETAPVFVLSCISYEKELKTT